MPDYHDELAMPRGAPGEQIAELIKAINDNDPDGVRRFVEKSTAPAFQSSFPMATHQSIFLKMLHMTTGVDFYSIRTYEPSRPTTTVVLKDRIYGGWHAVTLAYEDSSKHRISGILFKPISAPEEAAVSSIIETQFAEKSKELVARICDKGLFTGSQLVDVLVKELDDHYVFPNMAKRIDQLLRERVKLGQYESCQTGEDLADALTDTLQQVTKDKHLRVFFSNRTIPEQQDDQPASKEDEAHWITELESVNFGVALADRLPGNIGYVDLRQFAPARYAEKAISVAMTFVADTDALIIDLRQNGGGDPNSVAFMSSYLFDERTHLNDLYWRDGERTEQFWTTDEVPGKKYGQKKDVYVLISKRTFSGAEEFAYNLKNLKRGVLVGETTGGGAHPGGRFRLHPHFSVFIPTGRAINPITKTNWEGVGVVPNVNVSSERALNLAQAMAMKKLIEAESKSDRKDVLRVRLAELTRRLSN